jgi:hypothetical protein
MAIRINTEDNEIIVSDVATEETLRDLLKAVEDMNGGKKAGAKPDPVAQKTQEEIKKLAKVNKDLNITMKDWSGNFDDTMQDLDKTMSDRGKAVAGALGKIVKNTGNVINDLIRGPASFDTLGRAIQQGAGALGDGLGSVADSFQVMGTKIPGVGAALSGLGAATGAAAMAIAAYSQNMYDGFIALSQSGANYNGDIVRTASQIQQLGLTMNSYTQIVQQNASGLAAFGGTVSQGAKRFVELADTVHHTVGGELYALGLSYEEQAEQLAKYTQTQTRNTNFQNMGYREQTQLYKEYIGDLNTLVGLTGKSRQQLAEEMAQNNLRADANVRLQGATLEAQKALQLVFSTAGEGSAISQILMAGVAGKDLALEMAAGNSTIKSFVAGNSDAAQKLRDLGDAVATGQINQDEFAQGIREILPSIAASGEEFEGLYGISDVATVMTQAASDVQKLQTQFNNLGKAVGEGDSKTATGAGGAILMMGATLTEVSGSLKSAVNGAVADFAAGFGDGKDGPTIQQKINTMIASVTKAGEDISKSFGLISKELKYFAADPLDYVLGGASNQLKNQIAFEEIGNGDEIAGRQNLVVAADAAASNDGEGTGFSGNQKQSAMAILAKSSPEENAAFIADPSKLADAVAASNGVKLGFADSAQVSSEVAALVNEAKHVSVDGDVLKSAESYLSQIKAKQWSLKGPGGATVASHGSDDNLGGFGPGFGMMFDEIYSQYLEAGSKDKPYWMRQFKAEQSSVQEAIDFYRKNGENSPGYAKAGEIVSWLNANTSFDYYDGQFKPQQFKQYGGNIGAVGMDNPYVVGERGPELFTPSTGGTITPNDELATTSGTTSVTAGIDKTNKLLSELLATATNELESNKEIGNVTVSKLNAILGSNRKSNRHIQDIAQQG